MKSIKKPVMVVDKKPIMSIITHKNIIVERMLQNLTVTDYVPVYFNMNYDALIGVAKLRKYKGAIQADIHLFANIKGFPAIAYRQNDGIIYALGICAGRNIDKTINSL